jgi:spore maturation protein CgeB
MRDNTILILTYNYNDNLKDYPLVKYVKCHFGAYLSWDIYLVHPLKRLFSKVIIYDYLERRAEIGLKAVNEEILSIARKEQPKYVLWTSFYYDVFESTLDTIRNEGSIVVGWFFDDEWRFDAYSRWWISSLDYVVTNAREAVPKYRDLNARVILTIPNTGVSVDHDWSTTEEKYSVSFVGTRSCADRDRWTIELKNKGIPVSLFGTGWGRYISFDEMLTIFKTSKINLNFSKTNADPDKLQIKGRIFQVCLAGGFLLTEYAPGIEDYFEIDKEIICFKNTKEMLEKIYYYLSHEPERRAIAQAGWRRAYHDYTSSAMVSRVFQEIENDRAMPDAKRSSHPVKMKMPMQIRKNPSRYHLEWGIAALEENQKIFWKDDLKMSLSYNQFNLKARYYYICGFLPRPLCVRFIYVYGALEKLTRITTYSRYADYIPVLRGVKRRIKEHYHL